MRVAGDQTRLRIKSVKATLSDEIKIKFQRYCKRNDVTMSTLALKIAKDYFVNDELKNFINDATNFKGALFMLGEHSAVGVNMTHDFYSELIRNVPDFIGNINVFFSYLIYIFTEKNIIKKITDKCYPNSIYQQ